MVRSYGLPGWVADSPQKPLQPPGQSRATTHSPPGSTHLNGEKASGFRCGEDRGAPWDLPDKGGPSEDAAEELLLPEGVLRRRDRHDQRVVAYVRVTVGHQVRRCFGHLYPVHARFHLELLHGFPGLGDAGRAVVGDGVLHGSVLKCASACPIWRIPA